MESRFELRTFGFDTMLDYHLSQKLKLIGRGKFNHLINTLTRGYIYIKKKKTRKAEEKLIKNIKNITNEINK
jgi:hypothetical protein